MHEDMDDLCAARGLGGIGDNFRAAGARLWCLGTTKDGHPRHPLYVRGDQPLVAWEPQS